MADLVITAASVAAGSGAQFDRNGTAGATITAGQLLYKDTANLYQLSDANGAAAARKIDGVAMHASLAGQPIAVQTSGQITIGATIAIGTVYGLSDTPGGITAFAPGTTGLLSGMGTCILGVAITTTVIDMKINNSGVAVP